MNRPYFLTLVAGLLPLVWGCQPSHLSYDSNALSQLRKDTLKTDWTSQDLFLDSLPIPRTLTGTNMHEVDIRAFKQRFHAHLDSTWVLGYVPADTKAGRETLPGPTIEAMYGQPTRVVWRNTLKETLLENPRYTFPNKWYPIVYNLNDSLRIPAVERSLYPDFSQFPDGLTPDAMMEQSSYYATTIHLHGANVAWRNDGYPSSKVLEPASLKQPGHHPIFDAITFGLFGPKEKNNQQSVSYHYPNTFPEGERTRIYDSLGLAKSAYRQPAYVVKLQSEGHHGAILWYHDHAMMRTSTNVYTGLAGAYLIKGDGEAALISTYTKHDTVPDIPLLISDKSFTQSGRLYYNTLQNDANGENGQPEFFGNTMTVNGKIWPYLNVSQGLYRFRLINSSPSRFIRVGLLKSHTGRSLQAVDTVDQQVFMQIGTEGGLMPGNFPAITRHSPLTLAPGERADVLINFSTLSQGDSLVLVNYAPNEPYGDDGELILDTLTNQIMQFRINKPQQLVSPVALQQALTAWSNSAAAKNMTANLDYFTQLNQKRLSKKELKTVLKNIEQDSSGLSHFLGDPALDRIRRFAWTIVEAGSKTEFNTMAQLKPFRSFLAKHNMVADSLSFPMAFMGEGEWNSEADGYGKLKTVRNLRTEIWAISNRTEDAHPIHTHLNRFRILARQRIDSTGHELRGPGDFVLPEPNEYGWKDVVRVKPNFETYILVQYILNPEETNDGQFVYHCHILAHEDASMMRRLVVRGKKSTKNPTIAAILANIPFCGSINRQSSY